MNFIERSIYSPEIGEGGGRNYLLFFGEEYYPGKYSYMGSLLSRFKKENV